MKRLPMTDAMYLKTLEGRKRQTRRSKAYGKPGDILAVTCAWCPTYLYEIESNLPKEVCGYYLRPTMEPFPWPKGVSAPEITVAEMVRKASWRPPMFMPTGLARLHVRLTEVREEPLQDITEEDCIAEGIESCEQGGWEGYAAVDMAVQSSPRGAFAALWDSIHGKRPKRWLDNSKVWVHVFKKVEE